MSPILLCWPLKVDFGIRQILLLDVVSTKTPSRKPSKRGTLPFTTVFTCDSTVIIDALVRILSQIPVPVANKVMRSSAAIDLDCFGSSGHSSEGNSGDGEGFHCVDSLCFCKFVLIKNLKFMAAYKGFQFRAKLPFRAFD